MLEDGRGGVVAMEPDVLHGALVSGGARPELVFISSCFSGRAAAAFLAAGVPHVIAVQEDSRVIDASAVQFASHFFLALFQGQTVKNAFLKGRMAVWASKSRSSGSIGMCAGTGIGRASSVGTGASGGATTPAAVRSPGLRRRPMLSIEGRQDSGSSGSSSSSSGSGSSGSSGIGAVGSPQACCCAHLHRCGVCEVCRSPVCCASHSAPCHAHKQTRCCNPEIPHDESLKFLLLPAEADHNVVLFNDVPEGQWK